MRRLKLPGFCAPCTTGSDITPPVSPTEAQQQDAGRQSVDLGNSVGQVRSSTATSSPRVDLGAVRQEGKSKAAPTRAPSRQSGSRANGGSTVEGAADTTLPRLVNLETGEALEEVKAQARRPRREAPEVSDQTMRMLNDSYLQTRQQFALLSQSSTAVHNAASEYCEAVAGVGRVMDRLSDSYRATRDTMDQFVAGRAQLRAERRRMREVLEQIQAEVAQRVREEQGDPSGQPPGASAQ